MLPLKEATAEVMPEVLLQDDRMGRLNSAHLLLSSALKFLDKLTNEEKQIVLLHYAGQESLNSILNASIQPTQVQYKSTYYSQKYAMWIAEFLRKLIGAGPGKRLLLPRSKFGNCEPSTLYLRVLHGWMYLIDYLDPTGEFKSLRNNCKTSKNSIGVEISFLCGQGDAEISNIDTGIQIAKVKEVSNLEFRKDLDEWLETAVEGEKKEWRVALGADEASWLRNEYLVSMADSIVGTVLPDKVIIIKSKDLAAIMQSQL